MSRLLCLAGALVLMTACAGPADTGKSSGYASPTGAAFLGYHGPVHRLETTDEH